MLWVPIDAVRFLTCPSHVFIPYFPDVSAGELINPPKPFEELDKESREGHDLYIVSHNDYYVGKFKG